MGKPSFSTENNVFLGTKKPLDIKYTNSGEYLYNIMKNNPNVIAQLDHTTGEEDTMMQLLDEAVKCALWLKKEGVRKGDIVSLMSLNNRYSVVTCLAALFIGAVFNSWDPEMNTYLARHFIRLTEPKVIFTQQKSARIVLDTVKLEHSEAKVVTFGDYPGSVSFLDVLQAHSDWDVAYFQCEETDTNQTAVILFSSGTTGLPKAVELMHKTVLVLIDEGIENYMFKQPMLWFSSLYWFSGFMRTIKVLAACGKRIIAPGFEPRMACELIEKYKIVCLVLSSCMANLLIRYDDIGNHDLSSLKIVFVGGSILAAEAQEMMKKILSPTMIVQAFVVGSSHQDSRAARAAPGAVSCNGNILHSITPTWDGRGAVVPYHVMGAHAHIRNEVKPSQAKLMPMHGHLIWAIDILHNLQDIITYKIIVSCM